MASPAVAPDAQNLRTLNSTKGFLGTTEEMVEVAPSDTLAAIAAMSNEELLPRGEKALQDIADDILILAEIRKRFRDTNRKGALLGYNSWKEFVEKNSKYSIRTVQNRLAEVNGKDETKVNDRYKYPRTVQEWKDATKGKHCPDDVFTSAELSTLLSAELQELSKLPHAAAIEMCPNCTEHPHLLSEKPVDGNEHWTVKTENQKYKTCEECGDEVRYGKGHAEDCSKGEPTAEEPSNYNVAGTRGYKDKPSLNIFLRRLMAIGAVGITSPFPSAADEALHECSSEDVPAVIHNINAAIERLSEYRTQFEAKTTKTVKKTKAAKASK
jgi:hypothetical protein